MMYCFCRCAVLCLQKGCWGGCVAAVERAYDGHSTRYTTVVVHVV